MTTKIEMAMLAVDNGNKTNYLPASNNHYNMAIALAFISIAETLAEINEKMPAIEVHNNNVNQGPLYTPGDEG